MGMDKTYSIAMKIKKKSTKITNIFQISLPTQDRMKALMTLKQNKKSQPISCSTWSSGQNSTAKAIANKIIVASKNRLDIFSTNVM